jgi:hypothetical protein
MQKEFLSKRVGLKSTILIIVITFSLVVGLSENLTGNAVKFLSPAKIADQKAYIGKDTYRSPLGQSQCDKVGGTAFQIGGLPKLLFGKPIQVISVSKDTTLISVNRAKKSFDQGIEKYIASLYVTVFSTATNDVCLIVRTLPNRYFN